MQSPLADKSVHGCREETRDSGHPPDPLTTIADWNGLLFHRQALNKHQTDSEGEETEEKTQGLAVWKTGRDSYVMNHHKENHLLIYPLQKAPVSKRSVLLLTAPACTCSGKQLARTSTCDPLCEINLVGPF